MMISDHRTMKRHIMSDIDLKGCIKQQFRAIEELDAITNEIYRGVNKYMGRIEQQFRASEELDAITNETYRGVNKYMGRIEHITTQQIIGEWGSISKFASSHGVSPASTKMVIYVDGAKSRPVEEALRKYGYLNLLRFEKELRKRGRTFSDYLAEDGLNPVELIETIRMKAVHPEVLSGLKQRGYWGVLETEGSSEEVDGLGKRSKKEN